MQLTLTQAGAAWSRAQKLVFFSMGLTGSAQKVPTSALSNNSPLCFCPLEQAGSQAKKQCHWWDIIISVPSPAGY